MKITSLQENLKSGLTAVSHIAGKNVNLPILNNILIEAKDGNIRMISTDLEIGIVSSVRGKVEKEGSYTVDAKVISEFVALLPNQKVEIRLKETELVVESDNYKTTIKGQSAEDFPLIPQVDRNEYVKVEADAFRKALQQVIFAVSSTNTRMELGGVLFRISGKSLTLAATDSYRLAEKKIGVESNVEAEKRVIVPAKTLQEVVRILSNIKNEEVDGGLKIEFYITDNQLLFAIGSIELVSRLIEGQYPEYEQIIPLNFRTTAFCDKSQIGRAVKASSIFSKSGVNDINLDFPAAKNRVVISSTSSSVGENVTDVEAQVKGDDNGIVINYRFLLDGINNIEGDKIKLEVVDGATPCVLKSEKDQAYIYVIMPIRQ